MSKNLCFENCGSDVLLVSVSSSSAVRIGTGVHCSLLVTAFFLTLPIGPSDIHRCITY